MSVEPGWCGVCGLPVPAGEPFCRRAWPGLAGAGDDEYDDEPVPGTSHRLALMTELAGLQGWRCPWCRDYLPDSPPGTAIDHIIPRIYGGPHRRWNLQLLHGPCNSAKGNKVTPEALELADAHGVTIGMSVEQYRAGVRRRAIRYARRVANPLGAEARARAMAAARDLTVFFPDAAVNAVIRAAAEQPRPCSAGHGNLPAQGWLSPPR